MPQEYPYHSRKMPTSGCLYIVSKGSSEQRCKCRNTPITKGKCLPHDACILCRRVAVSSAVNQEYSYDCKMLVCCILLYLKVTVSNTTRAGIPISPQENAFCMRLILYTVFHWRVRWQWATRQVQEYPYHPRKMPTAWCLMSFDPNLHFAITPITWEKCLLQDIWGHFILTLTLPLPLSPKENVYFTMLGVIWP